METFLTNFPITPGEIGALVVLGIVLFVILAVLRGLMKLTAKIVQGGCLLVALVMGAGFLYVLFN